MSLTLCRGTKFPGALSGKDICLTGRSGPGIKPPRLDLASREPVQVDAKGAAGGGIDHGVRAILCASGLDPVGSPSGVAENQSLVRSQDDHGTRFDQGPQMFYLLRPGKQQGLTPGSACGGDRARPGA